MRSRPHGSLTGLLLVVLTVALIGGCKKAQQAIGKVGAAAKKVGGEAADAIAKKGGEAIDAAQKKASELTGGENVVEAVANAVDTDGSVTLSLNGEVSLKSCYAKFIPGIGGRQSLLQIRTYGDDDANAYPAAFLHVPVDAANPNELMGKTLQARVFIQDASGALWDNVDNDLATLTVNEVSDKLLKLTVTGGQLLNTKTSTTSPIKGVAVAVLR